MDSLKQELVGKVQQYLGSLERTTLPPRQPGHLQISHIGLVTNVTLWTSQGPRYFSVTVREHLT